LLERLDSGNHKLAVEIAGIPDRIRGFVTSNAAT